MGKSQNDAGIGIACEILGNFTNAVCVILWLFLGIEIVGTFLAVWKPRNRNQLGQLGAFCKNLFRGLVINSFLSTDQLFHSLGS